MPPAGCTGKHVPPGERPGIHGKQTLREVARGSVSVVICGDTYAGEFGICELWAVEHSEDLHSTHCCFPGRCWWPGALEGNPEFTSSLGSFVWKLILCLPTCS